MTRKSKREIENILDELSGAESRSVHGWVREWMQRQLAEGFDLEFSDEEDGSDFVVDEDGHPERTHDGEVCILQTTEWCRFYSPEEAVPEWIDVDADLPVREVGR